MPGRHRLERTPHHRTRKLAIGALGASALVIPLTPGIASADTPGLDPHVPKVPGVHRPRTPQPPAPLPGSHESRGKKVVQIASEQFGHPYMWGADGPVAFDCSGLTKYVYHQVGVELPHNAAMQYDVVHHVAKSDKRLGDLIFIYDETGIFHVGIYAGDGQMWAAGHTGDVVRKQAIWTDSYVVGRP